MAVLLPLLRRARQWHEAIFSGLIKMQSQALESSPCHVFFLASRPTLGRKVVPGGTAQSQMRGLDGSEILICDDCRQSQLDCYQPGKGIS